MAEQQELSLVQFASVLPLKVFDDCLLNVKHEGLAQRMRVYSVSHTTTHASSIVQRMTVLRGNLGGTGNSVNQRNS